MAQGTPICLLRIGKIDKLHLVYVKQLFGNFRKGFKTFAVFF